MPPLTSTRSKKSFTSHSNSFLQVLVEARKQLSTCVNAPLAYAWCTMPLDFWTLFVLEVLRSKEIPGVNIPLENPLDLWCHSILVLPFSWRYLGNRCPTNIFLIHDGIQFCSSSFMEIFVEGRLGRLWSSPFSSSSLVSSPHSCFKSRSTTRIGSLLI